jgi:hypothetical protein
MRWARLSSIPMAGKMIIDGFGILWLVTECSIYRVLENS